MVQGFSPTNGRVPTEMASQSLMFLRLFLTHAQPCTDFPRRMRDVPTPTGNTSATYSYFIPEAGFASAPVGIVQVAQRNVQESVSMMSDLQDTKHSPQQLFKELHGTTGHRCLGDGQ